MFGFGMHRDIFNMMDQMMNHAMMGGDPFAMQQQMMQQQMMQQQQMQQMQQQQQQRIAGPSRRGGAPIIEEPGAAAAGGNDGMMMMQSFGMPGMQFAFSAPNNSMSFSSFSSSSMSSNNGVVYSHSSSTTMGPGGVVERKEQVRDGRTGKEKMVLERRLGDKARRVTKERDVHSGQEETRDEVEGIDRSRAHEFEEEWQNAAAQSREVLGGGGGNRRRIGEPTGTSRSRPLIEDVTDSHPVGDGVRSPVHYDEPDDEPSSYSRQNSRSAVPTASYTTSSSRAAAAPPQYYQQQQQQQPIYVPSPSASSSSPSYGGVRYQQQQQQQQPIYIPSPGSSVGGRSHGSSGHSTPSSSSYARTSYYSPYSNSAQR